MIWHYFDGILLWIDCFQSFIQKVQILTKELKKKKWQVMDHLPTYSTRSSLYISGNYYISQEWIHYWHRQELLTSGPTSFWILEAVCSSFTNFTNSHLFWYSQTIFNEDLYFKSIICSNFNTQETPLVSWEPTSFKDFGNFS